jgi:ectoine hydroxylase-related dioxygenase (phytanoyl-CoA dioxygenase family)
MNWGAMSASEQRKFFAKNGFVGVSEAIPREELEKIHREIAEFGLSGLTEHIWAVPSFAPLIENKKVLSALRNIFGDEVRFFKGAYTDSPPRGPVGANSTRTGFHVDYGVGEASGDFRNSCASWINVGFYLTALTPENSPLWIVPGSNHDYSIIPCSNLEHWEKDARMVLAKAGDAILFHCNTVHAGGYNVSNEGRRAVYLSYRPAWARPVGPVPEWPKEFVDSAPPERRRLLLGLNKGIRLGFQPDS